MGMMKDKAISLENLKLETYSESVELVKEQETYSESVELAKEQEIVEIPPIFPRSLTILDIF